MIWPFPKRKGVHDSKIKTQTSVADRSSGGLGVRGEKLAAKFLKKLGYKILAKNYRCPTGEADLIALDKKQAAIVFVEVKARSSDSHVNPESAVNSDKQRRLRKIAQYYISKHPTADYSIRFDVISVVARPGEQPDLKHIPEAFY